MRLNNQLKGALGENIVINELLFHGWIALNLNAAIGNSPNVDVIATKGSHKINIQVKTSLMSEAIVQIGYDHKNTFLNNKDGPLADYVVFVRINTPRDYETYIVPVDIAEATIGVAYHNWNDTPKKDGSKRSKFPASIYFKPNKNRPDDSNYIEKWSCYRDAWHLLETST